MRYIDEDLEGGSCFFHVGEYLHGLTVGGGSDSGNDPNIGRCSGPFTPFGGGVGNALRGPAVGLTGTGGLPSDSAASTSRRGETECRAHW
jgi:hypothetical protein